MQVPRDERVSEAFEEKNDQNKQNELRPWSVLNSFILSVSYSKVALQTMFLCLIDLILQMSSSLRSTAP